jgi:hypothetical protein
VRRKLGILILLIISALGVGGFLVWQRQNQFVVIIDEHDALSIAPDLNIVSSFLTENLAPNSFVLADNQSGQAITINKLRQIKIVLTDEVQKDFGIKYSQDQLPVISSGISVKNSDVLVINVYINEDYIEDAGEGSWLFTSSLAHTVYYIRDLTTYSQVLPPEIFRAYNQTIPSKDVSELLESGVRFGEVTN